VLWGNSRATGLGEAYISAYSCKELILKGYNIVKINKSNRKDVNLIMYKTSHLIIIPDFKPTWPDYIKRFPVEIRGKNAILYKAVHKKDGKYFSDYDKNIEYKIDEVKTHEINKSQEQSCSTGLHIADKTWARCYGSDWSDMALLECEVPINKIVVAKDCDGKVRTSQLKVIREVPKEEYFK
jgi:hypothetical protein